MRILIFLVLTALLAGCTDGGKDEGGLVLGDGTKVTLDPKSSTKGALAGVVVDEAIRPIVGATVTLTNFNRNVTTDAKGVFTITDLEPGTYFVAVEAKGFLGSQASADVEAGKSAFVKMQLLRDSSPIPFHVSYKHDGFMQAWGGIGQYFVESVRATGTCDCRLYFQPEGNASTFVYEAFWKPTTPDPADLGEFYWILDEVGSGGINEAGYCYSPCNVQVSGQGYAGKEMMARLDGPDLWVAVQQPVRLIVTAFFNADAPKDWSIANQ